MLRRTFLAVTLITASALAQKADPFAEGVRTTEPLEPAEQRAKFKLPPGFEIQLVAAEPDLRKPMNMAFDATGRLWVSESREYPFPAKEGAELRDSIRIFSDFGPDGKARKMEVFADKLNIPIGLYPFRTADGHWKCVAWSIPNIWLFEDTDGDGKADKREVLFGPLGWERDTHGNQASFRRGDDGWIYATHGFNNNSVFKAKDGSTITLNSGNVYRFRLDGSRVEQWTHGQVNPYGLCWDDYGNLFSADCHSSPIYQLLRGGYYPSFGKPHDGLGFAPQTIQHSHGSTAICGPMLIRDTSWPAEYQGQMLVGNVMTSRINRDRIEWRGSSSKGIEMPDFLTSEDPWFRPVDLQWGPDGALYIADFYNRIIGHYEVPLTHPGRDRERGRIWRVVYKGDGQKKTASQGSSAGAAEGADLANRSMAEKAVGFLKNGDGNGRNERKATVVPIGVEKMPEGTAQKRLSFVKTEDIFIQTEDRSAENEDIFARNEISLDQTEIIFSQPVVSPSKTEDIFEENHLSLRQNDLSLERNEVSPGQTDKSLPQIDEIPGQTVSRNAQTGESFARREAKVVSDFSRRGAPDSAVDQLRTTGVSAERSRVLSSTVSPTKVVDSVRPSAESAPHLIATTPESALPMAVAPDTSLPKEEQIAALIKELGSPNPTRRSLALNELGDRFGAEVLGTPEFNRESENPFQRAAMLYLRCRDNGEFKPLEKGLVDNSPLVKTHALRLLRNNLATLSDSVKTEFGNKKGMFFVPPSGEKVLRMTRESGKSQSLAFRALADPDAIVRRTAVDVSAAFPNGTSVLSLLGLLHDSDKADDHLAYSIRVALRDHLQDPELVRELNPARFFKEDMQTLIDILPAVRGEHAALLRLGLLEVLRVESEELAKHLPSIMKTAPVARLNDIAAYARQKLPGDAAALSAILTALDERGVPPGDVLAQWAGELVPVLLSQKASGWENRPYAPNEPDRAYENPWALQDRKSSDGQTTPVMSSFPKGEKRTGILRSAAFAAPEKLRFYLCGHDGTPPGAPGKKNFVRLIDADGKTLREAAPPRNDTAQRIEWDLADVRGKMVRFEATDGDSGEAYAWLAFGRFKPELPELALGEPSPQKARAAELAGRFKLLQHRDALVALLTDRKADVDSRAAAAKTLIGFVVKAKQGQDSDLSSPAGQVENLSYFSALLTNADEPDALREKLAVALGSVTSEPIVSAMPSASAKLQQSFATALSANRSGTVALITAIEAGKASPLVLRDKATADRLRANAKDDELKRLEVLLAKLPAANVEADKLIADRRANYKGGDIAKGADVFKTHCAVCHQIGQQGALVGPQLDGVGGRGLDRIIEDILDPNRNVDRAFRLSIVTLKDGGVASGLLRREEGGQMVLADIVGKESSVPLSNVAKREENDTSLMPAAFDRIITKAEFNDLLAYLLSQRPTK